MERKRAKDRLWIGLVAGIAGPLVAYGILIGLIMILQHFGLWDERALQGQFPHRTFSLLAICTNIIPVQIFNKRYMYNSMRGVVFPTLVYVILWVVRFQHVIFG